MEFPSSTSSFMGLLTPSPSMDDTTFLKHLELLQNEDEVDEANEILTAPIFTEGVKNRMLTGVEAHDEESGAFSQYGLLAASIHDPSAGAFNSPKSDPRLFYNVAAPSSVFICGSQGSGKSHTLSCLLENCLVPSKAAILPRPLTGLMFHYDTFVSDAGGLPCEAAFLSSEPCVKVRVLCAPTNIRQIKRIYACLPNVTVEELRINESDLNTKRMLDLMAVSSIQGGGMPLYLHVVTRILRDLRIQQQQLGTSFDYGAFQRALAAENLTDGQRAPLQQRLETLESFMVKKQAKLPTKKKLAHPFAAAVAAASGNDWTPVSGQLTIIDLSCPCVTAEMACALFNICLSLFLEQDSTVGRVIALDEAHKYMAVGSESQTLTESLLSTIRLQRHLGARVFISTQEPTISPRLLDLCSVTIVHRFSSPDWLQSLKRHLAGVSACETEGESQNGISQGDAGIEKKSRSRAPSSGNLLSQIVGLRRGQGLMFAPGAVVESEDSAISHLGKAFFKIRVRQRVTADGGRSILAG